MAPSDSATASVRRASRGRPREGRKSTQHRYMPALATQRTEGAALRGSAARHVLTSAACDGAQRTARCATRRKRPAAGGYEYLQPLTRTSTALRSFRAVGSVAGRPGVLVRGRLSPSCWAWLSAPLRRLFSCLLRVWMAPHRFTTVFQYSPRRHPKLSRSWKRGSAQAQNKKKQQKT